MHNLPFYADPILVIYAGILILFVRIWLCRLAKNRVRNAILQAGASTPVFDAEMARLTRPESTMSWAILALLIVSLTLRNPWRHLI